MAHTGRAVAVSEYALFQWLIICDPDELPVRIGNLLRCFAA